MVGRRTDVSYPVKVISRMGFPKTCLLTSSSSTSCCVKKNLVNFAVNSLINVFTLPLENIESCLKISVNYLYSETYLNRNRISSEVLSYQIQLLMRFNLNPFFLLPQHIMPLVFSGVRFSHLLLFFFVHVSWLFFVVYVSFPCLFFNLGIYSFDYRSS